MPSVKGFDPGTKVYESLDKDGNTVRINPWAKMADEVGSFEQHIEKMNSDAQNTSQEILDDVIKKVGGVEKIDKILHRDNSQFVNAIQNEKISSLEDELDLTSNNYAKRHPEYQNFKEEMIRHIDDLHNRGLLYADVAKVWLNPNLMSGGTNWTTNYYVLYDKIRKRNIDNITEDEFVADKDRFHDRMIEFVKKFKKNQITIQDERERKPDRLADIHNAIKDGNFLHFNADGHGEVNLRYYLTTKNGKSAEGLRIFSESLDKVGLKDKLYFKIATGSDRLDNIVIYKSDKINDDEMTNLLNTIVEKNSQSNGILEDDSSRTLPIAKINDGIGIGAEPDYINRYLRLAGIESNKTHSYNTFLAKIIDNSIRIASVRLNTGKEKYTKQKGKYMNKASINEMLSLDNEDMKEEMMGVMKEFLRLAKINPNTMMPEK